MWIIALLSRISPFVYGSPVAACHCQGSIECVPPAPDTLAGIRSLCWSFHYRDPPLTHLRNELPLGPSRLNAGRRGSCLVVNKRQGSETKHQHGTELLGERSVHLSNILILIYSTRRLMATQGVKTVLHFNIF